MDTNLPKILLVDDRKENIIVLQKLLKNVAAERIEAASGNEALKKLVKHPDIFLVLLDVNMPDMSGFEVASLMRDDPALVATPIIFITAGEQSREDLIEAYQLGAVDFIHKPLNEDILLAKVNVFVELKRKEIELQHTMAQSEYWRCFNETVLNSVPSAIFISNGLPDLKAVNKPALDCSLKNELSDYLASQDTLVSKLKEKNKNRLVKTLWCPQEGTSLRTFTITLEQFQHTEQQQILVVLDDITEEERARRAAEEADQAKSTFLANISHEIRTPLNGILGMTSLLARESLSKKQTDFLQTIHNSGEHLLSLINDVLDFSKIESGKMEFENISFDLNGLVENCVMLYANKAQEKGLEIVYNIEANAQVTCIADKTRITQILCNLISNGIKFTKEGYVKIHVSKTGVELPHTVLRFSVKDTGIGIPKSGEHKLFDVFTQVESATTRKYGGTGLGLAICKSIVEALGGEIGWNSRQGKGSEFFFTLPVRVNPTTSSPYTQGELPALRGKTVVAVDDLSVNLEVIKHNLELWGMKVSTFQDPRDIEAIVSDAQSADLVILDYQMPEVNGIELAAQLKEKLIYGPPMMLFSSSTTLPNNARNLFEHIAYKPFRLSAFYDALMSTLFAGYRHESNSESTQAIEQLPYLAENYPLKILVAEDNLVNIELMKHYLGACGYKADFAENGQIALDKLCEKQYDLILMDMRMPVLDGLQTTREVFRIYGDQAPQIVALTANATVADKKQCLAAGMVDFLTKPVVEADLVSCLQECSKKLRSEQVSTPSIESSESEATPKVTREPDSELLDIDRLNSLPLALLCNLSKSFERSIDEEISNLRSCFTSGDVGELAKLFHKVKGAAMNLGCSKLGQLSSKLQRECESNKQLPTPDVITDFEALCTTSLIELKCYLEYKGA
ncbi:response regulator [Pseudoalteromonas sp. CO348]|uniref:response regulator n=1 Tax=Pseudoalteromonas sp. CO348 TaxID=1777271 RepID=UPI0010235327|nr:response regulator [Pseudoalteromonas sp. CO348]RZG07713.1 response regulator [Pseudoalteromonas sp. CO348]